MWKKILLGVAGVVVALLGFAATRPPTYNVERSTTITAPPDVVFAQINDFHRWSSWSPWEKMDPTMKRRFGGAPSGTGATYAWEGNDQVGTGNMTITASRPPEQVDVALVFVKPFAGKSEVVFSVKPGPGGSKVTWAMTGHNDFLGKLFGIFMNFDQMIGADFEKGLASMKTFAEAEARPKI